MLPVAHEEMNTCHEMKPVPNFDTLRMNDRVWDECGEPFKNRFLYEDFKKLYDCTRVNFP